MYNPDVPGSTDTPGEWIELYNRGTTDTVNLKNWNFKDLSSTVQSFTITTDLFVGPNQYKVLGQSTATNLNGNVTVDFAYPTTGPGAFFLTNSADAVIMTDSSGVERGRVVYSSTNGFVNSLGASISLRSPELDTNVGANWCTSGTIWVGSTFADFGTPGAPNAC
jgi:Lamin Tail Domain